MAAQGRCSWMLLKRAHGHVTFKRVEDAATEAKVAENTIWKWVRAGIVRTAKQQRYTFVSMADVTRHATTDPRALGEYRTPRPILVANQLDHALRQEATEPFADNSGDPWDATDDEYLILRSGEADLITVATELGRTFHATASRLTLLRGRHWAPDPAVVQLADQYAQEERRADGLI